MIPDRAIREMINRIVMKLDGLNEVMDKKDFNDMFKKLDKALDKFRREDVDSTK